MLITSIPLIILHKCKQTKLSSLPQPLSALPAPQQSPSNAKQPHCLLQSPAHVFRALKIGLRRRREPQFRRSLTTLPQVPQTSRDGVCGCSPATNAKIMGGRDRAVDDTAHKRCMVLDFPSPAVVFISGPVHWSSTLEMQLVPIVGWRIQIHCGLENPISGRCLDVMTLRAACRKSFVRC